MEAKKKRWANYLLWGLLVISLVFNLLAWRRMGAAEEVLAAFDSNSYASENADWRFAFFPSYSKLNSTKISVDSEKKGLEAEVNEDDQYKFISSYISQISMRKWSSSLRSITKKDEVFLGFSAIEINLETKKNKDDKEVLVSKFVVSKTEDSFLFTNSDTGEQSSKYSISYFTLHPTLKLVKGELNEKKEEKVFGNNIAKELVKTTIAEKTVDINVALAVNVLKSVEYSLNGKKFDVSSEPKVGEKLSSSDRDEIILNIGKKKMNYYAYDASFPGYKSDTFSLNDMINNDGLYNTVAFSFSKIEAEGKEEELASKKFVTLDISFSKEVSTSSKKEDEKTSKLLSEDLKGIRIFLEKV